MSSEFPEIPDRRIEARRSMGRRPPEHGRRAQSSTGRRWK